LKKFILFIPEKVSEGELEGQECLGGRSRRATGQLTSTCVAGGWRGSWLQLGVLATAGPGKAARHNPIPQHSGKV
jgi:hypothetical protein